ncbi:hypothetical protein ACFW5V_33840 [Streptomyces sp. NPDC058762]|uniref:hypothetical protein n=1 Tax=Streptomyces sp. NPDC058762 TaxID=3346629 RepID=UPI0036C5EC50
MADRDWNDDTAEQDAVRRADRAARAGWAAIAGVTGALGCALIVDAVFCALVVVGCLYVVVG